MENVNNKTFFKPGGLRARNAKYKMAKWMKAFLGHIQSPLLQIHAVDFIL